MQAFNREDLVVMVDSERLQNYLKGLEWRFKNLLLMSSGNFNGIDLNDFGTSLLKKTEEEV